MLAVRRSAGVAPEAVSNEARNWGNNLGFETTGKHHQKYKNSGTSGPTKRACVLPFFCEKIHYPLSHFRLNFRWFNYLFSNAFLGGKASFIDACLFCTYVIPSTKCPCPFHNHFQLVYLVFCQSTISLLFQDQTTFILGIVFTCRQRSCGKVMFSIVSVSQSVQGITE